MRLTLSPKALVQTDEFTKKMRADWESRQVEALRGTSGWLPEADWPDMRVYRFEAGLKSPDRSLKATSRLHFDGYVVHFTRNASLTVETLTDQDPPAEFRAQVEAMLKTFRFDAPPAR